MIPEKWMAAVIRAKRAIAAATTAASEYVNIPFGLSR